MEMNLRGKTVLVTGASKGIGLATARLFASEGCRLSITARNLPRLEQVAEELRGAYRADVQCIPADLSQQEDVVRLGESSRDVDILVNNAGGIPRGTIEEVDVPVWKRSWDLKVFGYIGLTRIVFPAMCARGSGTIVNVIGSAGERPDPNYVAGCMANAALNMMVECLGGESVKHGVRVVAVNPGPVMTERFMEGLLWRAKKRFNNPERWPEILEKDLPIKRAGTPEEVAGMVVFLASGHASYISGASIRIDAGFSGNLKVAE